MRIKKMNKLLCIFIVLFSFAATGRAQYSGGISNGFAEHNSGYFNLSVSDSLYNGGNGNGFSVNTILNTSLAVTDSLYNGGSGNGFSTLLLLNTSLYLTDSLYNGGSGKGEIQLTVSNINLSVCSDTAVWNGNDNLLWNNPANWDCGTVPGINSVVFIPAGRPRYPVIMVSTEIKKLEVQPGAAVIVFTGKNLTINGH